ncbi:MAG: hypothetical protein M1617_06245 [Actinobacteria bacterium]|nr:hypothetical protein [Actinomycetota bacterium]
MSRTKLFQEPGSPLIQVHSRTHRKFLTDVAVAAALGVTVAALYRSAAAIYSAGYGVRLSEMVALVAEGAPHFALLALLAVFPASLGVWLARRMGWRYPWVWGAVVFLSVAIVVR